MKSLLTLCVFIVTVFLGCESTDPDVQKSKLKEELSLAERHEKLRSAIFIVAEFANEPSIRHELLGYSTQDHDYELVAPFSKLFASSTNNGRVHGAFAASFRETISSATARSSDSDLESFLVDNGLVLYAPYLAEQFADSDLPITVTWHDGIDTTGVTEGIIYEPNGRTSMISVDDDYAFNNPTYVIMFDDDPVDLCEQEPENCNNDNNGGSSSIPYTPRDIDCRDLKDDDVLEVRMPEVRLISNTRSWPYRNKLHLFVVTGDFTVNNGIINVTPDVNELWDEKEISRYRARNRKWLSSGVSFLLNNWIKKKSEMRIALAYKNYGAGDYKFSGTIGVDTSDNEYKTTQKLNWESKNMEVSRPMFNVGFDRCSTMATITSDTGFGLKNGSRIYRFDKFEFYFELDPR